MLNPSFWISGAEVAVKSEPLEGVVARTVVDVVDEEEEVGAGAVVEVLALQ